MLNFTLLLNGGDYLDQSVLSGLRDRTFHLAKISTIKKEIGYDRKDSRYVSSLKNVKLIYRKFDGGILILIGNLECQFREPYGGVFFCKRIVEETTEFETVNGVEANIQFVPGTTAPMSIEDMESALGYLLNEPKFEYNISQFEDFMELFNFYKSMSDELNNNITYEIVSKSEPYYFIPSDVKEFDEEFKTEVKNNDGVLIGYKISAVDYTKLKNEVADKAKYLIDVRIKGGLKEVNRVRKAGADNIYLSNSYKVNEINVKSIKQFIISNYKLGKEEITFSGELKKDEDYDEQYLYFNVYDMGQKIKIESIDNSLRLINQGATGAASELLEYLIGDKPMPNDNRKRQNNAAKEKYMDGLNESQRKAFLMAVDGEPVSLIKGPPGTGKTHVINAIVQYITKELGEKVVISSQTHIAIDNVLDKLMTNRDLIIPNRITNRKNRYSDDEIDKTLYKTWASQFEKHNKYSRSATLAEKMIKDMDNFNGSKTLCYSIEAASDSYDVIGATTTTSAISGKKGLEVLKGYDWLIIDEVSKCPITEVLRYLPYVSKIIMVGDDFQLAPLLEFSKEDVKDLQTFDEEKFEKLKNMYEQSVFAKVMDKAQRANRLVLLNENYRSVRNVLDTYNVFYKGELIGRREEIRPEKVQFSDAHYNNNDVFFVEVFGGQENTDGTSRYNMQEIAATANILEDLMKETINPENVTVSAIFPYAAQISRFQKENIELINKAKRLFKSFEIDTVDSFQGKETDIVLVDTVVTDASRGNFLNDFRRINVSMSRARDKLFVFGNSITLKKIKMRITGGEERQFFKDIYEHITANGLVIKYNGGETTYEDRCKSTIKII